MKIFSIITTVIIITAVSIYSQTAKVTTKGTSLRDSSEIYVQKIISSKIPVLVDFWAVWCGPCKMLTPIISEIKKEYKGKIKVLKINVDRNRSLAGYFKVTSIPSVFIIKNKIVINRFLGVQSKAVYVSGIKAALETKKAEVDSLK